MMKSQYNSAARWNYVPRLAETKDKKRTFVDDCVLSQETFLGLMLIPMGLWLGENWIERIILGGSILLVLMVFIYNHRAIHKPANLFQKYSVRNDEASFMLWSLVSTGLLWIMIGIPKLLF